MLVCKYCSIQSRHKSPKKQWKFWRKWSADIHDWGESQKGGKGRDVRWYLNNSHYKPLHQFFASCSRQSGKDQSPRPGRFASNPNHINVRSTFLNIVRAPILLAISGVLLDCPLIASAFLRASRTLAWTPMVSRFRTVRKADGKRNPENTVFSKT